ncbi:ABC transporter ATP-binding protein [Limimaricola soesokkakensis]|uniref:ABC transporter ATP-binding protein n=1 Tax=Limimaricola soesokkakensis TaxID=1343159 RepID=UPI003512369B
MIRLENLSKSFHTRWGRKVVIDGASVTFPSGVSVALLARNGAGKSTLMGMIGGTIQPSSGHIVKTGTVSWPVGFRGSFHRDMTGAQNTRFVARIYGVETQELLEFVEDFAELGPHFHSPVRTYSAGMMSRLAFGVSIGIPFDTYLVDEVTSVGDADFKRKSRLVFLERMKHAGAVVVTHSMGQVRKLCQAGVVLENGKLIYFEDVEAAIARHQENMGSDEEE